MEDYSIRRQGRQRTLFSGTSALKASGGFYGISRQVDRLIEDTLRLHKADSFYYLLFPEATSQPNEIMTASADPGLWVGRDVIGHVNLQGSQDFFFHEFSPGIYYSFPLSNFPQIKDLFDLQQQCREFLLKKGVQAGTFWRIRWELSSALELKVEIQIFLKDYQWGPLQ